NLSLPDSPMAALLFDHRPEMLVGLMGALKAGCAYVPLDPLQPTKRLASILRDSGAHYVLTVQKHLQLAREIDSADREVISIEEPSGSFSSKWSNEATPDDLAYL